MKREGMREGQVKELDGGRVEETGRSAREGARGRKSGGRDAWWWQERRKWKV